MNDSSAEINMEIDKEKFNSITKMVNIAGKRIKKAYYSRKIDPKNKILVLSEYIESNKSLKLKYKIYDETRDEYILR